jgi:hypothetical protein
MENEKQNQTSEKASEECPHCGEDYVVTAIVPGLPGGSCCLEAHIKAWQKYMASIVTANIKLAYEEGFSVGVRHTDEEE